jgi:hypothetical protein
LIVLAMFTARNAGMAFNRYLDAAIDARNPRTASRHIPRGVFSRSFVLAFALANAALFVVAAGFLNPLCLKLSPVALVLLFSYSAMKRFTSLSHLVLGLTLGSSPVAAWAAVRGTLSWEPFVLGGAVIFWVAGFDVIYATQDYEFDKKEGLHSLAVTLGVQKRPASLETLPCPDDSPVRGLRMAASFGDRLYRLLDRHRPSAGLRTLARKTERPFAGERRLLQRQRLRFPPFPDRRLHRTVNRPLKRTLSPTTVIGPHQTVRFRGIF